MHSAETFSSVIDPTYKIFSCIRIGYIKTIFLSLKSEFSKVKSLIAPRKKTNSACVSYAC